ncbi:HAUS augmin-like complex subunit 3 [Phymastichus coffea]|uniref:HAUS augmin-like complex subunit 3 n=1 Tax=Phymastichus coffea TaxID=108790 RepID=UPI00273C0D00|nr:HAUS augmin-like complex subunit 3 [Phymastichus coffea]
MNKVTGTLFHEKLRELIPSLSSSITPEVLNKLCEDDSVQPFLKWFYININKENILSDGCIKLKKFIEKNDTWLQGKELELALEETTQRCPELLKLIESDYWNNNQSEVDFNAEKELYNQDLEYLQFIENSIQKLKLLEEKLDIDLENETDAVEKEDIKVELMYNDCMSILEDFDDCHRQFFTAVDLLTETYRKAFQKKGDPCIWTQMPIELCIKQLETYNNYLNTYAKTQFSMSPKNDTSHTDHHSFLNESCENEKLRELINCQTNLFTSKMHEIMAKIEENASKSLVNYVKKIYNDGNLQAPSTPLLARAEIAELTNHRDFLEENVNLLQEQQLVDVVQQLSITKVIKIMEKEAQARLDRRKDKLSRLQRLCTLAREHGYAFSTLLCMLFELQIHRINEIVQFVIDARYYLSMEYSLSSTRSDIMLELEHEYKTISSSPTDKNAFNRFLLEMTSPEELKNDVQASAQYYEELRKDNTNKLQILLNKKLEEMIESSKNLEEKVLSQYNQEIINNPTLSFKAIPYHVQNEIDKTVKQLEKLESNVESMRNRFKVMINQTDTPNYEREKLLIWQRFLADPESLKSMCEEYEKLRDHAMF